MMASRTKLKEPAGCEARVQLISENIGFDAEVTEKTGLRCWE